MDAEERFNLIKRGTVEIVEETELREALKTKKDLSMYIGRAPTGPLHIGHIVALSKLLDFQKAGVKTKILIADVHAALDDLKAPWEALDARSEYTQRCIELALPWIKKPEFIRGSSYQLKREYVLDVLKLSTQTTIDRAMRAASEVTRMKNPKVSEMIYPIMQALDEQYLDVDIQLGGTDQRHILMYAREYLPLLGYRKRIEVMTPLIASLNGPGTKMSSSIPESHIKIYDSEEAIKRKIKNAYCPAGIVENNMILQIVRYVIFPATGRIKIERPEKYGGTIEFEDYNAFEEAFIQKKIHPDDIKGAVSSYLIETFKSARDYFAERRDWLEKLGKEFLPN